jgi:hypothetical protein
MEHIRAKMGMVEQNGPFLAKLWKTETSQYRVGEFVETAFPPRSWYVLNNVIVDTPQLVRIKSDRDAIESVHEENFRWQGNLTHSRNGRLAVGPERNFTSDQLIFRDPELKEAAPGVFRPSHSSVCRNAARIKKTTVRPYVDRAEIVAVLDSLSDLGAQEFKLLTTAEVGPKAWPRNAATNDLSSRSAR